MATQNSLNFSNGSTYQILEATTGQTPSFQNNTTTLTATLTLTSSQIKNLHGTPVQIIPAPSAGTTIFINSFTMDMDYGGTSVFVAALGQSINLYFGLPSLAIEYYSGMTSSGITAAVNKTCMGTLVTPLSGVASTSYEASAIYVGQPIATEISGDILNDSTMTFNIGYSIL